MMIFDAIDFDLIGLLPDAINSRRYFVLRTKSFCTYHRCIAFGQIYDGRPAYVEVNEILSIISMFRAASICKVQAYVTV